MSDSKTMIVRLFGPGLSDVSTFVRGLSRDGEDIPICWDEHPEVVVKCTGPRIVGDLCARYGQAVYTFEGRSMESVVGAHLAAGGLTLSVAESCTGGLLGQMLTSVPGASNFFAGGVIAYSNQLKASLLGVPDDVIDRHGAVSEPVVLAMAAGMRRHGRTDVAVSVSGVAGPGGGSIEKPVGTLWFGLATPDGVRGVEQFFKGNRAEIRRAAAIFALDLVRRWCIGRGGNPMVFEVAGQSVMN